jgi:hypothetical protein
MATPRRLPNELVIVWLLFAVVTLAILVTYARLRPEELYHVSGTGLAAGFSRALVYVNFPVGIAALAALVVLFDRLWSRPLRIVVVVAAALCAVIFWPGVVDQNDLDAKWVNALPALGVGLAVLLTIHALRSRALPPFGASIGGDRLRVILAIGLLLLALPWIAAELGFYLDGVPVLGSIFLTGDIRLAPGQTVIEAAVHHGDHHGLQGTLLVLTALLLSRMLDSLRPRAQTVLRALLGLMIVYGLWNVANDGWLEQVVKRGWTNWRVPDVLRPTASVQWAILLVLAAALAGVLECRANSRSLCAERRRQLGARLRTSRCDDA